MSSSHENTVRVLPLHVANKIAAGEVVERPASVVKELVENAIDAGAAHIRVSLQQGGTKLISVLDDGCGMTEENARLSFERQATSKIHDVEDIENISTLGFRGEALPSIASISRLTMTTRRAESDEGVCLQVDTGAFSDVHAAGCPVGTRVDVRDLFCNVPARKKFLRSRATEESHVRSVWTRQALAHPDIAFSLTIDGREIAAAPRATTLSERIRDLFGEDFFAALIPLPPPTEASAIKVSGFIEKPNLFVPTRREQFVFVNKRPASSPSIAYALREAYPRRALDARPATILFIDLNPREVDVNVHPTKRDVRFRDDIAVKKALVDAFDKALRPATPSGTTICDAAIPAEKAFVATLREDVTMATPVTESSNEPAPADAPLQAAPVQGEIRLETSADGEQARPWKRFTFLAQMASGYLLVETDSGLVTIHPAAAQERILYEKLRARDKNLSQTLLIPETVRLSSGDVERLNESLDVLRDLGFHIEPFGNDTFKVDAVPLLLGSQTLAELLSTIAQDLAEGGARKGGAAWKEERIAKTLARAFAGANLAMTPEGAAQLIEELSKTRMPYVCPRGKPVMIFTSTRELNRKFDR